MFDGKGDSYTNWRMGVTYWIVTTDHHYLELLRGLEHVRTPITLDMLTNDYYRGQSSLAITRALYSFLIDRIDASWLQRKHVQEFNGYELWRKLYVEFFGNDQAMHDCMEDRIRRFERCTDKRKLDDHISEYLSLWDRYGGSLTQDQKHRWFLTMLPPDLEEKYSDRSRFPTLQSVQDDLLRLSEFHHSKRLVRELTGHKSSLNVLDEPPAEAKQESSTRRKAIENSITSLAAMISGARSPPPSPPAPTGDRRPPRPRPTGDRRPPPGGKQMPDARFPGCWHCGQVGHTRQTWDEYIAYVGMNPDGSLKPPPKGYAGAYEVNAKKAQAAQGSSGSCGRRA